MIKNHTMEIWKPIKGYEDLYLISNYGNIISKSKSKRKWDKPMKLLSSNSLSYKYVDLSKDGIIKRHLVHRLVAFNFIDNIQNKPHVNHINGIKSDNRVENLEWVTPSENQKHSIRIGLRTTVGEKNSQCKITSETALSIYNEKLPIKDIAKKYNVTNYIVIGIKYGYSWTHITGAEDKKKKYKLKKVCQ